MESSGLTPLIERMNRSQKRPHGSLDSSDDEVEFCGEKTREQRDAELLAEAVDVEDEVATPAEIVDLTDGMAAVGAVRASCSTCNTPIKQERIIKVEHDDFKPQPSPLPVPAPRPTLHPPQMLPQQSPPPPPALPPAVPPLDPDQQRAVALALTGSNLFLTGGAGVGKSFTLRAIIEALIAKHGERHVAVTASTGTASVQFEQAQTLHSLSGVGVPLHISDFGKIWRSANGQKKEAWREMRVLVIDEVSMLDAEFLDWLSVAVDRVVNWEEILHARGECRCRCTCPSCEDGVAECQCSPRRCCAYAHVHLGERRALPFGGRIQLIFCGDFMQLPPVRKRGATQAQASAGQRPSDRLPQLQDPPPVTSKGGGGGRSVPAPLYHALETHGRRAFQSVVWREANLTVLELTRVHRQRDPLLLDALNEVRMGHGKGDKVKRLLEMTKRALVREPSVGEAPMVANPTTGGDEPVLLFCDNARCDGTNDERLRALLAEGCEREKFRSVDWVEVDEDTVVEEVEQGRAEDEVRNELEEELWQHHVREYDRKRPEGRDDPSYDEWKTFAIGCQVMLTQNEAPGGFVNGDIGVVIGLRCATQEELDERDEHLPPLAAVTEVERKCRLAECSQRFPFVQFRRSNRRGDTARLVLPLNAGRRLYRVGKAVRRALPLKLAWAITVHKSQGMSIPQLTVELGNAFDEGQCYVAISRAQTLDGLCIRNFDAERVKVSFEAMRFHEAVSAASLQQSPKPMAAFFARAHFWWKDLVEGPRTHPAWVDIYTSYGRYRESNAARKPTERTPAGGTSIGSEMARWIAAYPVPERLRRLHP